MITEKENIDDNQLENSNEHVVFEFKYNFLNTPWDDRTKKSKFGIVSLLLAIFLATMACVVNNFIMHYRGFDGSCKNISNSELNCLRVKMEDYPYVARIHSTSSKELLCVGAVVSGTSILANGVCVKSGPIRVHLGSTTQRQCKKGFTVDVIEMVHHEGVISKKLALLSSYDGISKCSQPISIGTNFDWSSKFLILGRPMSLGRTLSRQHVSLVKKDALPVTFSSKHLNITYMICVNYLARCPIRAGDLLVQNGKLFGLSATSVHRTSDNNIACFADLSMSINEIKELDVEIESL